MSPIQAECVAVRWFRSFDKYIRAEVDKAVLTFKPLDANADQTPIVTFTRGWVADNAKEGETYWISYNEKGRKEYMGEEQMIVTHMKIHRK